ncbi:hypothetical protein [Leucobacter sp. M11]|uniref:hypothetical protein n=1 Tax=Leucobacter sp. M11 TaxID=2993565 RepID=UPI002D7E6FBF|nr:hypothetical protein [Leucobacter sp. M11]MEB4614445.1 hypothetical protein [Leucobacter sp. M11]
MSQNTTTHFRLAAAVGGALSIGLLLSACGAIDTAMKSAADAWSVTYEVTTDSADPVALTEVSYLDMETRTSGQSTVRVPDATTAADGAGLPRWTAETIVITGDSASVSATPPEGVAASCRILLDGKREIAAETGQPGEPVRCDEVTPKFD